MVKLELLQDATDAIIKRLTFDSGWVYQEKHNGERRSIEKQGTNVRDYNRNGLPGKGLPPTVLNAIRKHPMYQFVLDVELVKNDIFLFDMLYYGDEVMAARPYSYREQSYHAQFDGYEHIIPVQSARTPEDKVALIQRLRSQNAEGFVAKELCQPYRPAEANRRYNYRYKFVKELDAVVIGDSQKRRNDGMLKDSVRLGLFDAKGHLKDICGATKKSTMDLHPGDVVTIAYLYGTGTLDVVQPRILRQRFDKAPQECLLSQIIINKNWRTATA